MAAKPIWALPTVTPADADFLPIAQNSNSTGKTTVAALKSAIKGSSSLTTTFTNVGPIGATIVDSGLSTTIENKAGVLYKVALTCTYFGNTAGDLFNIHICTSSLIPINSGQWHAAIAGQYGSTGYQIFLYGNGGAPIEFRGAYQRNAGTGLGTVTQAAMWNESLTP